jgi:hypothetical protein
LAHSCGFYLKHTTVVQVLIWPARLAERYVTADKKKTILSRVNDLVQADKWFEALSQIIG